MRSGKLRYHIEIQKATTTVDELGTPLASWQTLAFLRAELVQQSTEEFMRNQGASDEDTVVFRTRFVEGITNAERVLFDGVVHNIREIVSDPMRRHLEIRTATVRAEP
ncbi:head-tail adaptor protein [Roseovarius sp. A46]|uniref:phage head closure protein n=1 Tax=Roseovarius sp. A46 TaxID=2109331 RepID=UPI0010101796|nr:phage head closure protein [Roseovarius sp. A46]RXV64861.1 head-tail adaptor protein [Roseovarius sp. A46]